MSESAEELYSKRGEVILGPDSGSVSNSSYRLTINGTRIRSVLEAEKSYIITFNSNDPEWANMALLVNPGLIKIPLKQLNSTTYIVKFTATGAETGVGIYNQGSGKMLTYTNYTLYEYQNQNMYPDNVLRPFMADKMYYRNQEVQKLYLGSRLLWELKLEPAVPEATFTLFARHGSKTRNDSYVSIGKQDFTNFSVDPSTVTAITVNGRRYDVARVEGLLSNVLLHIENASDLELNGFETLTIHYRE